MLLSVAYFLLCVLPCLQYRFSIYQPVNSLAILELIKDSVYVLLFLYLTFAALNLNKFIFKIASFCLFVSGAVASYYLYFFKMQPSVKVLTALFNAESQDFIELINIKLFIWTGIVSICWYFLIKACIFTKQGLLSYFFSFMCLIFVTSNIVNPQYKFLKYYFPSQYLISFSSYLTDKFNPQNSVFDISSFPFEDNSADDLKVILVIGESARFDRFGINGYERNTTPNLQNLKNLQSFKATSCDSITYTSVPCMLRRSVAEKANTDLRETTVISIFNKLGFKTSWFGAQSMLRYLKDLGNIFYDEAEDVVLPGGSALYRMNTHDEDLIPLFEAALAKEHKSLIVLHTSGSHWDYAARYPAEFEVYKPICDGESKKRDYASCSQNTISNMYDNSILYTDHVLSEIIGRLKNENAILFYISDHGESLGENGIYGHGGENNITEQMTVPFLVWTSDKFNVNNPGMVDNLSKKNKKEINYKYLFHSILDCSNIDSDIIDHNFSLCR